MAITAAMRQDIMELAVLMNNKAPGTTLLGELGGSGRIRDRLSSRSQQPWLLELSSKRHTRFSKLRKSLVKSG